MTPPFHGGDRGFESRWGYCSVRGSCEQRSYMAHALSTREAARALRLRGESLRSIAALVGVAPSTVSIWVRDLALPEAARARLEAADPVRSHRRTGQLAWSRLTRTARLEAQAAGRRRA